MAIGGASLHNYDVCMWQKEINCLTHAPICPLGPRWLSWLARSFTEGI